MTLGGRFSERGIAVGVGLTPWRSCSPSRSASNTQARSLDNPPLVIAPLALMVAIGMFQTVLMRSDVKYRTQAIVDPLTGVLNRMALAARVAELEQQSEITQHPIGVIADRSRPLQGDQRHPRARHGRRGPEGSSPTCCARACAPSTRSTASAARSSSSPRREPTSARSRASPRDTRLAIAGAPIAGVPVTASLGVSASAPGERFIYERVFARADAALYDAKRRGRNCVGRAAGAALPDVRPTPVPTELRGPAGA